MDGKRLFVDLMVAAGGHADDLTRDRVASSQTGDYITREQAHHALDTMFDVIERRVDELQGSKS